MKNKSFALSIKGGTARGMGSIGVIRYFQEFNLKPEIIAGSSAGAIIATSYALGMSWEKMLDLVQNFSVLKLSSIGSFIREGSFCSRQKFQAVFLPFVHDLKIEDLPVKLIIFAGDRKTKRRIFIEKGNLLDAITASCSYPLFFPSPTYIGGKPLVDGDLISSYSAEYIRSLGVKKVIGISGIDYTAKNKQFKSKLISNLMSIIEIATQHISISYDEFDPPDFKIEFNTDGQGYFDFKLIPHIVDRAYKMTKKNHNQIMDLLS